MAKLIGPLHSTEARGSIGALIYNTWRGLRTVKRFTSPSQPRTARQLSIRSLMVTCVRAWALLEVAERAAWNLWAANHPQVDWTGVAKRLTGANCYAGLSVRLLDMGKAVKDTPPAVGAPGGIEDIVATPGSGQVSIAFTAHGGTNHTIDAWLTGVMSPGAIGKIEQARHKVYAPAETTPLVITTLAPGYYTAFLRCVSEDDGQVSAWEAVTFTVT